MSSPPIPPKSSQLSAVEARVVGLSQSFSGPLPPPAILKQYDEICPGCAERMIVMFENEANHRRQLEDRMVDANLEVMRSQFSEAKRGQVFAFIISLAFLVVGAYTAVKGQPWVGGILGTMGLSSIVGAFIAGRSRLLPPEPPKSQQQNQKQKPAKNK